MKKGLLALLILLPAILSASYFSDGIRAYKSGNYAKAKEMLELSVKEEGAEQANFLLGLIYLKGGKGVKRDVPKSLIYLKKAVNFGNIRAKCYLAQAYLMSKKSDKKQIMTLLKDGRDGGANECIAIADKYNIPI